MTGRVLIIGGYGNFGSFIARRLSGDPALEIVIAGRSVETAERLAATLDNVTAARIDVTVDLVPALKRIAPDVVIHTSGPFQTQDYGVAEACIEVGCHYIDLADGRDFVANISALNSAAQERGVPVISGASSVPCLTSALVDHYRPRFAKLTGLYYVITTAQRTNRGLATTAAILSYVGRPFTTLRDGREVRIYGWQGLRRRRYRGLGWRWLGDCDVPDLSLLPGRYPELQSIRFSAGLEFPLLHLGLWGLSWAVRTGLIRRLHRWAPLLLRASRWFDGLGSADSGFHMALRGIGGDGKPMSLTFELVARSGDGPYIPCVPAILLARRLAADAGAVATGATACIGLISWNEYLGELSDLDVGWEEFAGWS